jgi:hypothetical protein
MSLNATAPAPIPAAWNYRHTAVALFVGFILRWSGSDNDSQTRIKPADRANDEESIFRLEIHNWRLGDKNWMVENEQLSKKEHGDPRI